MKRPDLADVAWVEIVEIPVTVEAPVGPLGARVLQAVDDGELPYFGAPAEASEAARIAALAAVVDSPHNQEVARAAARLFAAGWHSDGTTDAGIRRRVDLLLALPADKHLRRLIGTLLDFAAVVVMSDQRTVNGTRTASPSMHTTSHAAVRFTNEMANLLDRDDEHAQYVGYVHHEIGDAARAIRRRVESDALQLQVERSGGLQ